VFIKVAGFGLLFNTNFKNFFKLRFICKMALFNEILSSEESLFKDDTVLDFSHQPKLMKYREAQQRFMADCIKPLFQKRNGKNLFIHGIPGIGKTLACKEIVKELEEKADDIIPLYINCWSKNTSFKIYLELCTLLGYKLTQNKKGEELFSMLKEKLNESSVVFIFDEIDKVEDFDFLYSILEGILRKSVFLITNYKEWLGNVEERIRSRLMVDNLEFKPYNSKETEGILRQRIKYAFVPGVLSEDAFQLILKKTVELEDIRSGLSMLRKAGLNAENRSSKKISLEDAVNAIEKLDEYNIEKDDNLEEGLKFILNVIRKNNNLKVSELFKIYQEKGGEGAYRSFSRKVNKLADDKFISLEKKSGGAEGTTTIVNAS
jgi:cell division control protein 6